MKSFQNDLTPVRPRFVSSRVEVSELAPVLCFPDTATNSSDDSWQHPGYPVEGAKDVETDDDSRPEDQERRMEGDPSAKHGPHVGVEPGPRLGGSPVDVRQHVMSDEESDGREREHDDRDV